MFQQIKQLLTPEKWPMRKPSALDGAWWKKLTVGSRITFGYMEQTELSQKELELSDMVLYDFGQLQFLSYNLTEQGKPKASFIMAGTETGSPYLAISRKLSSRDLEKLFADEDLKRLSIPGSLRNLYVRDHIPGLKEWVTMKYTRRIDGIRGKKNDRGTDRVFEYALFVNESNEKAIEVEYFLDGHVEMMATIYRPMSDIAGLHLRSKMAEPLVTEPEFKFEKRPPAISAYPPRPVKDVLAKPSTDTPRVVPEELKSTPPLKEAIKETPLPTHPKAVQKPVTAPASVRPVPLMTAALAEPPKPAPRPQEIKAILTEKQATATTAPVKTVEVKEEILAVSMVSAARIITEAMSKNRRIGVVLRDILGLEEGVSDKVLFHLPLSDEDYRALAARYGVAVEDRVAIRQHILEELNRYSRTERLHKRAG